MTVSCETCGDTGKWCGAAKPCPECGAFAQKKTYTKQTIRVMRYIDLHQVPNRHLRRAKKHAPNPV